MGQTWPGTGGTSRAVHGCQDTYERRPATSRVVTTLHAEFSCSNAELWRSKVATSRLGAELGAEAVPRRHGSHRSNTADLTFLTWRYLLHRVQVPGNTPTSCSRKFQRSSERNVASRIAASRRLRISSRSSTNMPKVAVRPQGAVRGRRLYESACARPRRSSVRQ